MDNAKRSIDRAQRLLETPNDNGNYVLIKIKPISGECCCFHCWPQTWNEINNKISPCGPLEDEGDVLIGGQDDSFVLECHETGPEIIIYLGVGIASANLVKSVLDMVLTIVKNRQRERMGAQFRIMRRVLRGTKTIEENVMEIGFPLSRENVALLNKKIKDAIRRDEN
ncbi:MAG: hypothetical protein HY670_11270 [Chloroflexi bacterium]|nr:hypothetical protein [Chloroflexota bacterium]